ncbi:MAG TPA: hypothetical protein PLY70_01610 [Saprospiraceae bacterium]|nr:hypothetical protein [Saprospiraceae bacterium]
MSNAKKVACFEYLVDELVTWVREESGDPDRDLNRLKIIKLHFFISAASSSDSQEGLLDLFNDFHAMPYGHVESSIYDEIKTDSLSKYSLLPNGFTPKSTEIKNFNLVTQIEKDLIQRGISNIKSINPKLVMKSGGYLVDLSHEWRSWKMIYSIAKSFGKNSMKIPNELIMTETRYFKMPNEN